MSNDMGLVEKPNQYRYRKKLKKNLFLSVFFFFLGGVSNVLVY
jgi:hypothetical protein